MKEVLGKLDAYEILTNLFPGFFFGVGLRMLFGFPLSTDGVVSDVFLYYFLGLIVGRIGSIVVEPCLKLLHLIKFSPYPKFLEAEKSDAKIPVLLTSCNYYRSLLTCVLLFPIVGGLQILAHQWRWFGLHWKALLVVALILLFFASYKKQVGFIRARVEDHSSRKSE